MPAHLRLLPFRVADGPWNMAADEALLASAVAGAACLRFYAWSAPALSLGYFQPSGPALAHPHLSPLPWLRRPTGGAALVHHRELTYALALPPGRAWQPLGTSWLTRMHEVIRTALSRYGIAAHLCLHERKLGEVLCFLHHTPGDLLLDSCKTAGSAQRKQRGALLQHGGILLAQSPFTPSLPGIAELTGISMASESLAALVVEALVQSTGWQVERDDWTSEEQRRIVAIVPRYLSPTWNSRR